MQRDFITFNHLSVFLHFDSKITSGNDDYVTVRVVAQFRALNIAQQIS